MIHWKSQYKCTRYSLSYLNIIYLPKWGIALLITTTIIKRSLMTLVNIIHNHSSLEELVPLLSTNEAVSMEVLKQQLIKKLGEAGIKYFRNAEIKHLIDHETQGKIFIKDFDKVGKGKYTVVHDIGK